MSLFGCYLNDHKMIVDVKLLNNVSCIFSYLYMDLPVDVCDKVRYNLWFFLIVRCRWCLQGRIEWISQKRTCWRWLQWCWSSCHSIENWNYYSGNPNPKCLGRERSTYPRIDFCCPEKIQLPRRKCWGRFLSLWVIISLYICRKQIFWHNALFIIFC